MARNDWQPIATARKDGTEIDLWLTFSRHEVATSGDRMHQFVLGYGRCSMGR